MPDKSIPRTLYHGTLTKYVPSIRLRGLKVSALGIHPGFERDSAGCVFVTDSEKAARFFGIATAMDRGEREIDFTVLVIDRLKAEIGGVVFSAPQVAKLGVAQGAHQYVACKDIPPDAIVGYVRVHQDPATGKVVTERGDFDRGGAPFELRIEGRPRRRDVHVRKHRRRA
jgi:hypothetical protein